MALSNLRVLDVGCGGGILAESLAKQGANVTGIDASSTAIAAAQYHAQQHLLTIHYQQITAEAMAEDQPHSFDAIMCMELLEHVPSPQSLINACARLVKPGGRMFFSTLNRTPKAYALAIVGAEYLLKLLPKGMHSYQQFIRPAELATWLRQANKEITQLSGMRYNPLTRQATLNNNVDVNYLVCCQ